MKKFNKNKKKCLCK